MTDEAKALVERLRSRVSNREILLVDPPRPAPDHLCHEAADCIEEQDRHLTLSGKVSKALSERIEALEAENERLREALQFYAREYNWKSCGVYMCGHSNPSSAEIDRGNKARAALAGDSQ